MPATWDATVQVDPADTTGPVITSVAVPAAASYGIGAALEFTVNLDEPVEVVNVTGLPVLAITVGGAAKQATFVSGSTTTALLFSYTVASGDNGSIAVTALQLNGGTIKDAAGNDADLTLNGVGSTTAVADTTAPVIEVQGANPYPLTVGDTFVDPGATATDDVDGDLSAQIEATGTVDNLTPGEYTKTYSGPVDSAGNVATPKTRTIIVSLAAVQSTIATGMHFGIGFGIGSMCMGRWASAPSAFSPLSLFSAGEQGAWYDPSDLSTLFQDSAGTIAVAADGDPVGLILDKSQDLVRGAELWADQVPVIVNLAGSSGAYDAATNKMSNTVATTADTTTTNDTTHPRFQFDLGLVSGTHYEISGVLTGAALLTTDVAAIRLGTASVPVDTATGEFGGIIKADGATLEFIMNGTVGSITIDSISAKELPGNHASQSVAASRPTYRTDGTLHWLEFDGVDDFLEAGSLGIGPSDFFMAAAIMAPATNPASQYPTVLSQGYSDASEWMFRAIDYGRTASFHNLSAPNAQAVAAGSSYVMSFRRDAVKNQIKVGSEVTEGVASAVNLSSALNMRIGSAEGTSRYWTGPMYGVIFTKYATSDAERNDVHAWLNSKAGV